MPNRIVLDTSVIAKWYKPLREDLTDEALALRDTIDAQRLIVLVPELLLYELGNVLTLKSDLPPDDIAHILELTSTIAVVVPADRALLRRSAQLTRQHGLSFYDATFAGLAVEAGCTCVTADRRLVERARTLERVKHLTDSIAG